MTVEKFLTGSGYFSGPDAEKKLAAVRKFDWQNRGQYLRETTPAEQFLGDEFFEQDGGRTARGRIRALYAAGKPLAGSAMAGTGMTVTFDAVSRLLRDDDNSWANMLNWATAYGRTRLRLSAYYFRWEKGDEERLERTRELLQRVAFYYAIASERFSYSKTIGGGRVIAPRHYLADAQKLAEVPRHLNTNNLWKDYSRIAHRQTTEVTGEHFFLAAMVCHSCLAAYHREGGWEHYGGFVSGLDPKTLAISMQRDADNLDGILEDSELLVAYPWPWEVDRIPDDGSVPTITPPRFDLAEAFRNFEVASRWDFTPAELDSLRFKERELYDSLTPNERSVLVREFRTWLAGAPERAARRAEMEHAVLGARQRWSPSVAEDRDGLRVPFQHALRAKEEGKKDWSVAVTNAVTALSFLESGGKGTPPPSHTGTPVPTYTPR